MRMRGRALGVALVLLLTEVLAAAEAAKTKAGATPNEELRARKAQLVRKHLRRLKKREGALRLVDGGNQTHQGNVEVFHLGRWGGVCDDEWDERDAAVVCRQLGFKGVARATHNSHFGAARHKHYWMDNMYCSGEEKTLSDCRFEGWGSSDCTHAEAAGVICIPQVSTTTAPSPSPNPRDSPRLRIIDVSTEKLTLRLVGGRVPEEGRVEVKLGNSSWGLICGDDWSLLEANVVCRQLGLGFAADAVQTDFFGGKPEAIVLSGVKCRGNEDHLGYCLHNRLGDATCPGKDANIAAVVCSDVMADLVIDHLEIMRTAHLEDRPMYFLQCAMEENCLSSAAYKIQSENPNWHLEPRRLLRFTARIVNSGTAVFRPMIPKHLWEFHQCHMHYHSMEVFATFDIMDSKHNKVAEGHKASFCLEDNQCLPGIKPSFACANFGDQGISVNCSDIYRHTIDCQWVDISELEVGMYTFRVAINPEFKVAEMSYENNAAVCNLYYTQSFAHVYNCTLQRP